MIAWTEAQHAFLRKHYPQKGKLWCATQLNRTLGAIRSQTCKLGLKQDRNSEFFSAWQGRAAVSKTGRKRPAQSLVLKRLHVEGKLPKTAAVRAASSVSMKRWHATHEHPRGALGLRHTEEARAAMSKASKLAWSTRSEAERAAWARRQLEGRVANGTYAQNRKHGSWKAGWREIGGQRHYFRSRWEANYARYLELLKSRGEIDKWEHEPETFWFDGIVRGTVSYLPDFRVTRRPGGIEYHEVKGWMDDRSRVKIKRFRAYYPLLKLIVIDGAAYKGISRIGCCIAGWE